MEEMSKFQFAALSGCTYNDEICFVCIEPKSIVYSWTCFVGDQSLIPGCCAIEESVFFFPYF